MSEVSMQSIPCAVMIVVLAFGMPAAHAQSAPSMELAIAGIGHDWARATYDGGGDHGAAALERLLTETQQTDNAYPDRAEPKIWQAIVLASIARVEGGFGALGKAKQSRE